MMRSLAARKKCYRRFPRAQPSWNQSLFFELKRTRPSLDPRAASLAAFEVRFNAVAVLGSARCVAAGDVFLRPGAPRGIQLGASVGLDLAFDQQRTRLAFGAVQAAEFAVFHFADKAEGISQRVTRALARDGREPLAIEGLS